MKKHELKQIIKEQIWTEIEAVSNISPIYGYTVDGQRITFELLNGNILNCIDKNLKTLVVNDPRVEGIFCYDNKITTLKLGRLPNLVHLNCSTNKITNLNLSKCPNLRDLHCRYNDLTSLDLSDCPKLEQLGCNNNDLTTLDISNCHNLKYFICVNNRLTTLDISNCPNLKPEFLHYDTDRTKLIKENNLAEAHVRTFTDDEMLKLVHLYSNLSKLYNNQRLYKAVKEKEKTDPEFYKKLTAHMVSKTNRLPWGEPILELEPVLAKRIPNNDALQRLMEKDPRVKKELIDLSLKAIGKHTDDKKWDYVRNGWMAAKIERFTPYNIKDEIMLDDEEDDRLYLSVDMITPNYEFMEVRKLNYRGQTIYQTFY